MSRLFPSSIRRRVFVAVGALTIVLMSAALLLLDASRRLTDAGIQERAAERRIAEVNRVEKLVIDMETGVRGYVITREPRFLEPWRAAREQFSRATGEMVRLEADDEAGLALARQVERAGRVYIQRYAAPLIERVKRGDRAGASVATTAEGKRLVDALRARFSALRHLEQRRTATAQHRGEEAFAGATARGLGALAAAVALSVLFAYLLARGVTAPIRRVTETADRLVGEREARLPEEGPDEVRRLGRSFNAMADAVQQHDDMLEHRNAELADAQRETEAANRAKSEFLSRMSHELRTPLNAILGFGQLLETADLDPDAREDLEQIMVAGRHLLELIDEVLEMARIEEGRSEASVEPVDLEATVAEVVQLAAPMAREQGIAMTVQKLGDRGRHAMADRQRLRQILLNLISNAIKYNREHGSVDVAVEPLAGDRMQVAVADTGAGVPEDDLPRLFVPFERLGAADRGVEGTGLGLALSQRLAEEMGGSLRAQSQLGAGTTLFLELPSAPEVLAGGEPDVTRA